MKTLIASIFALSLLGGTAAEAASVHVGGGGVRIQIGGGHHDRGYHRHRHCDRWGYRHHQRFCHRWGW